jgi:hypothetical protein
MGHVFVHFRDRIGRFGWWWVDTLSAVESACLDCLNRDSKDSDECGNCGSQQLVRVTSLGAIVELPASAGVACSVCGEQGRALRFRRYRRVVGLLVFDRVHSLAGYVCSDCHRHQLRKHLGLTLLFGWWGLLAMLFRNPYAIYVDLESMYRAPITPESYGAIKLNDPSDPPQPIEAQASY